MIHTYNLSVRQEVGLVLDQTGSVENKQTKNQLRFLFITGEDFTVQDLDTDLEL